MSSTPEQQEPASTSFDFGSQLDEVADFEPKKEWSNKNNVNDDKPDPKAVEQAAKAAGFSSRNAAPEKEPSDQVSIRARKSVIDRFKKICDEQEPKWPQGFALEKALDALEEKLKG